MKDTEMKGDPTLQASSSTTTTSCFESLTQDSPVRSAVLKAAELASQARPAAASTSSAPPPPPPPAGEKPEHSCKFTKEIGRASCRERV